MREDFGARENSDLERIGLLGIEEEKSSAEHVKMLCRGLSFAVDC